jgi:hypothetical protein
MKHGHRSAQLSATLSTLLLATSAFVAAALVYLRGDKSIITETQIFLGFFSAILFIFIFASLYRGMLLDNDLPSLKEWRPQQLDDVSIDRVLTESLNQVDGGSGNLLEVLLSLVLSLLFWVLAGIVITVLAWLLVNVVLGMAVVLFTMIYWLFYHALRLALVYSAKCKGKIGMSLWISASHTIAYTGWIFLITGLIRRVNSMNS